MARNGLIVMTALPVSKGHGYLIDFALKYLENTKGVLQVMMYSRSFEPVAGTVRFEALENHYKDAIRAGRVNFIHIADDDIPQNPSEDPVDFWGNWKKRVRDSSLNKDGDYLFASEAYGIQLADTLRCEFIPCNVHREVIKTSGTKIRKEPITYFAEILPEMQTYFRRTVTLFGQESCGKTTMSRRLASALNGHMVPEWAREYLEATGPDLNQHKMDTIVSGQYTSQLAVADLIDKPFIIQDTDLLSTLGYYKLWKGSYPDRVYDLFKKTKSDLYFLMNDEIPFEPDALRYGGDRRETDKKFWIDILLEFDCSYHEVKATNIEQQQAEISKICVDLFDEHANMASFVRT